MLQVQIKNNSGKLSKNSQNICAQVHVGLWRSSFGVHLYSLRGWIETLSALDVRLHVEQLPLWLECDQKGRCSLVISELGEALALSELRDVQREKSDQKPDFGDEGICKVTPLVLVVNAYKTYIETRHYSPLCPYVRVQYNMYEYVRVLYSVYPNCDMRLILTY